MNPVELARAVQKRGCHAVKGHTLDMQTANVIVAVHEGLRDPINKRKLEEMTLERCAWVCWRLAR